MISQRGDQDDAVGAVNISPSAESFCVDHVVHAHPCCLSVFVCECLLGIPAQLYCWMDLGT